jgi:hypothetical protein
MNTSWTLSLAAILFVAGSACVQAQATPGQGGQGPADSLPPGSPAATSPQAMPDPGRQAASVPDQANSATYPAPATRGNSDSNSASSPHQPDSMRSAAARPEIISSGMDVQSKTGEPVGTVLDVVPSATGNPAYVVIADQSGSNTAVPYIAARKMVHDNKVIVDTKRLQNAPKVPQSQLQDRSNKEWQGKADSYWGKQPPQATSSG